MVGGMLVCGFSSLFLVKREERREKREEMRYRLAAMDF